MAYIFGNQFKGPKIIAAKPRGRIKKIGSSSTMIVISMDFDYLWGRFVLRWIVSGYKLYLVSKVKQDMFLILNEVGVAV